MSGELNSFEALFHPVRLRILQAVASRRVTVSELAALVEGVAATTVYRHVNTLIASGVLTVIPKRSRHGSPQRELALSEDGARPPDINTIHPSPTHESQRAFVVFLARLASEFDRLIESTKGSVTPDFGYSQTLLHVTDEDLRHIRECLRELLRPHLRPRTGREARTTLGMVLIPDDGPASRMEAPDVATH